SRYIAFFADRKLKKIEATGGPVQTLCAAAVISSGTWSHDGTILLGVDEAPGQEGIYRVSAVGGPATRLPLQDPLGKELRWAFWHIFFLTAATSFLLAPVSSLPRRSPEVLFTLPQSSLPKAPLSCRSTLVSSMLRRVTCCTFGKE